MMMFDQRVRVYEYDDGRVFYGASGYDPTGYLTYHYYEPDGSELSEHDALGRSPSAVRIYANTNRSNPLPGGLSSLR